MKRFTIVAVVDKADGIISYSSLPTHGDMAQFQRLFDKGTDNKTNVIITDRPTLESLPEFLGTKSRLLRIVLTQVEDIIHNAANAGSLDLALKFFGYEDLISEYGTLFVIGSGPVYEEAIKSPYCEAIELVEIYDSFSCDEFFPKIDENVYKVVRSIETNAESNVIFTRYERVANKFR